MAQILTIGSSVLHVKLNTPLPELILALSAVSGFSFWRRWKWSASSAADAEMLDWPSLILPISAVAAYVILWIAACAFPETTWDGNWYHLPPINHWACEGRICWINENFMGACYMNGYPKAVETMAFLLVKALHAGKIVNAVNLTFLPLGVCGLMYLAAVLGASWRLSLLAGAAWVFVPVNVVQAGTLYVDGSYASSCVAFVAVLVFILSKLIASVHAPWGWTLSRSAQ